MKARLFQPGSRARVLVARVSEWLPVHDVRKSWGEGRRTRASASPCAQRGLSLVELIVCIALIGTVASWLVGSFGQLTGRSADPLVQRQAMAVAESMLQEILAQGTGNTDQSGVPDAMGPEAGESRTGAGQPFDHVDDYDGLVMSGVLGADGSPLPGLESYTVRVAVRQMALGGVPLSQGLWVDVTVQGPGGHQVLLSGWRAKLQ